MQQPTAPDRLRRRPVCRLVAAIAALVLAATGLVAPTATARSAGDPGQRPAARHHARPGFLALGDSVPFGFRPFSVTPPDAYLDPARFRGYPEVLAARRHLRLANASCPGETTASFLDPAAQSNGCTNSVGSPVGYRTGFPLHVSYVGSQLDVAVDHLLRHRRTRLVSLQVGSNDLFVCRRTTTGGCTGADLVRTLDRVERDVQRIVTALRRDGRYRHRLVLMSYYVVDYRDAAQVAAVSPLNAALARVAARHGARVADGFAAMRRASAATDGDVCAAGLLVPLPGGGCDIHPSSAGQRVLARALGRVSGLHRHPRR